MANARYYGTGRRKKSIARVYLTPGTGKITINKRDIEEYFGLETLKVIVRQPLVAIDGADKFDVLVNVKGGGFTADVLQAVYIIPAADGCLVASLRYIPEGSDGFGKRLAYMVNTITVMQVQEQ